MKFSDFDRAVLAAALGMVAWLASDYFGGMFIYFFMYPYIVFPLFIFYLVTLFKTIGKCLRGGISENKISVLFHGVVLFLYLSSIFINSEFVKGEILLSASLKDDLFLYTLNFRKGGKCEMEILGAFGYNENISGKYNLKNDTIIFIEKPYKNDFISDKMLIDRKQKVIFIHSDNNGVFGKEKIWLNYFEIKKNSLPTIE